MKACAAAVAALLLATTAAPAESARPSPKDTAVVQTCLISDRSGEHGGERCIGVVADPCLQNASSTADMTDCSARELRVWDALLNEAYGQVRKMVDAKQQIKLRDMQRAWIASRDKTCTFYWDFHQGSIASPMAAYCMVRETGRRAIFLRGFLKS
jgi:uncharacterized protein YecT (DUF1311 family)